jgi:iron(II)-dependent oxidoreductase
MPTRTATRAADPAHAIDARQLIATMREFRARLLSLVSDLDDRQMIGPRLTIVNPPLWEIGHVACFQEFWALRHLRGEKPILANGDRLYNSTDVAHDTRWELLLPNCDKTLTYMDEVLERCAKRIENRAALSPDELYFYWLTIFHEGMHAEALAYTRQTLGYPSPSFLADQGSRDQTFFGSWPGDVEIPGGKFMIGAAPDMPFVFDNEKWAHEVEIRPFRIARAPVTNGQFLEFVEAGGYREQGYWSAPGWRWLQSGGSPQLEKSFARFFNKDFHKIGEAGAAYERLEHPVYWRQLDDRSWEQRVYDRYLLLNENLPVVHVSWYEAEAFCKWAGRRLPSEAEWEVAAAEQPLHGRSHVGAPRRRYPWGDDAPSATRANIDWRDGGPVAVAAYPKGDSAFGCRQMIGNVWEWTASDFEPYPGFTPDPYKEYSQPWFGTHKVLRGGCWATSALLIRNTWRNFYTPDRRDVWAGFRTCAK